MATLRIPERASAYRRNCVEETDQAVYGRDNRKPIHDAVNYVVDMTQCMNAWCDGIGLCVVNGKLNVIYGN